MRIVKKIEDFDGLENGMGARLEYTEKLNIWQKPGIRVLCGEVYLADFIGEDIKLDGECISVLKTLGFEFEWKPKRSLEEVLNDYKEIDFVVGKANYIIQEDKRCGRFSVNAHHVFKTVGTKYYCGEDADKICEELNS